MSVLWSYGAIGSIIGVGYIAKRVGFFTPTSDLAVNRLTVFIAIPSLYFAVIASGGRSALASSYSAASVAAMAAVFLVALMLLSLARSRRTWGERVMVASTAINPNSGNTGIPLSVAVLGSTTFLAPIILVQVAFLAPLVLIVTEFSKGGKGRVAALRSAFTSPLVAAAVAGLGVAILNAQIPSGVLLPFEMVGEASIPLMLLIFGSSLRGARPFGTLRSRPLTVLVPVLFKGVLLPIVAVGAGVLFGVDDSTELLALVLVGSLPVAQNTYAMAHALSCEADAVKSITVISNLIALPCSLGFVMLFA